MDVGCTLDLRYIIDVGCRLLHPHRALSELLVYWLTRWCGGSNGRTWDLQFTVVGASLGWAPPRSGLGQAVCVKCLLPAKRQLGSAAGKLTVVWHHSGHASYYIRDFCDNCAIQINIYHTMPYHH